MKKFVFILLVSIFTISCAKNQLSNEEKYPFLGDLIESYYHRYYEYPTSTEELLNYCNVYLESWNDYPEIDSIKTTLYYLQKEKKRIQWKFVYSDPWTKDNYSYPWAEKELLVLVNKDTLVREKPDLIFMGACWSGLIEYYIQDYFRFPPNLEELIEYSGTEKLLNYDTVPISQDDEFLCSPDFRAEAVLLRFFLKNQNDLTWLCEDSTLLIALAKDIIYYNQIDSYSPCHWYDDVTNPNEIFLFSPRYYDLSGRISWKSRNDEFVAQFRKSVRDLRQHYPTIIEGGINNWHFFLYTRANGLTLFCKDDDMQTNTNYFKDLETCVKEFAEENDFSKIVFVAPFLK